MLRFPTLFLGTALLALGSASMVSAQGTRADANGDGALTREEARSLAEARFARFDVNRDGVLDADDRVAARERRRDRRFDRMDGDDDGVVSRDEFATVGAALDSRLAARRAQREDALTDDRALESGERSRYPRRAARRGATMAMAWQADRDGDRRIDRAEFFETADARFERLDVDGDGVVRAEERRAARAVRRDRSGG